MKLELLLYTKRKIPNYHRLAGDADVPGEPGERYVFRAEISRLDDDFNYFIRLCPEILHIFRVSNAYPLEITTLLSHAQVPNFTRR